MKIEVAARRSQGEGPSCVFCRDAVRAEDALGLCPSCGVTFHEACRVELARCPSVGCPGFDGAALAAEEEQARRARIEAARARREAEDRTRTGAEREAQAVAARALAEAAAGRAVTAAAGVAAPALAAAEAAAERARRAEEARARAAEERAREAERARAERGRVVGSGSGPWRPASARELGLFLVGGMAAGAVAGLGAAYFVSRHGVEWEHVLRWVPGGALAGLVEALLIAACGVRREPLVRWGKSRDASCLHVAGVSAGALAGVALFGASGGGPLAWLGGMAVGALLAIPVALRLFGTR